MTAYADVSGADPRRVLGPDDLAFASQCAAPEVARPRRGGDNLTAIGGALAALGLGAITLIAMSHERDRPARLVQTSTARTVPQALPPIPLLRPTPLTPERPNARQLDLGQSRASPMVVDNTSGGGVAANVAPPLSAAQSQSQKAPPILSVDEQFSARMAGDDAVAHASSLMNPAFSVMQGTIVPAVLETALNSDLPGYARAVVSRDVKAFDGSRVAIPRGSRLIGQYKSGLATGQSRAFIVWTRLIRPDGASIALGSPALDNAGETGLSGKVDRHFLQRFGSAALLSVVSGISAAMSGSASNTVVVGTGLEAQSAAAQALATDGKIAPTVRVPQGTPIQVFTARDLDFSEI